REPDQQRHRVLRDQLVGLVGVGEEQARGHASDPTAGYSAAVAGDADLVRAWHEAACRGCIDELLVLTHPDFEMTEPSALPGATHVKGREALRSYCYGWAK